MDRVLSSAELLNAIFQFTDARTQARGARVRKAWFDVAARVLWHRLNKVDVLFRLFPVVKIQGDEDCYRTIDDNDWKRFKTYAKFVKCLTISHKEDSTVDQIFQEIAYTRSMSCLLPNLTDLTIDCGPHSALRSTMFLNEGLQRLEIRKIKGPSQAYMFLHCAAHRSPNIKSLIVSADVHIVSKQVHVSLSTVLKRFKQLEALHISSFGLTSDLVSAAAFPSSLKKLHYTSGGKESSIPGDEYGISIHNVKTPFISLEEIVFESKMVSLTRFLGLRDRPAKVTSLDITITGAAIEISLQTCSRQLTFGWRNLTYLAFHITLELEKNITQEQVNYKTLEPLFNLPELREFVITCPKPLLITDKDAQRMAYHWSRMTSLHLNPEPLYSDRSWLTLEAVASFATHCKKLENLELYIDATKTINLPLTAARFQKLELLSFGSSYISDPDAVALYLGQVFPVSCELYTTLERNAEVKRATPLLPLSKLEQRQKMWVMVARFLKLISKSIEQDREVRGNRGITAKEETKNPDDEHRATNKDAYEKVEK